MDKNTRVYFKDDKIREDFFQDIRSSYAAKTWRDLANTLGIYRSVFQRYQYGINTLPCDLFAELNSALEKSKQQYFLQNISTKEANWGAKLGGKITSKQYPEIFEKGRMKAIKSNWRRYHHFSRINMPLSEIICEFIGALIGDGFIGKYENRYLIEVVGNLKKDKQYINYLTNNLEHSISILKGKIIEVPLGNVVRVRFHSKPLFHFLINKFDFPVGKKSFTIKIPDVILASDKKFIFATIRGIFDTDGCVYLDERPTYKGCYPRITLQTVSKNLYLQLKEILSKEFSLYTHENVKRCSYCIEVYGLAQLEKWMQLIGFSNERNLAKVRALSGN